MTGVMQVATKGYSKVLTDSALKVNFFIYLNFFHKSAKMEVLSRPQPSVNMPRVYSGNTDPVNTSEIIIVASRDLINVMPQCTLVKASKLSDCNKYFNTQNDC